LVIFDLIQNKPNSMWQTEYCHLLSSTNSLDFLLNRLLGLSFIGLYCVTQKYMANLRSCKHSTWLLSVAFDKQSRFLIVQANWLFLHWAPLHWVLLANIILGCISMPLTNRLIGHSFIGLHCVTHIYLASLECKLPTFDLTVKTYFGQKV